MKKLLLGLVVVQFFYSGQIASASDLSDYGYEQRVQLSPVSAPTTVGVELPMKTRNAISPKFSNLEIINARNELVPFDLYDERLYKVEDVERVTVSSIRVDNDPADLLDDNRLTEFAFDEKVDGAGASTILVDFGESLDLHRIQFWTSPRTQIRGMQIRMGADVDRLKTVRSESAFTKIIDGTFPLARFVEISLWGPSVKLEDVIFYARPQAEVYFTAEPGMSYKLLFGNEAVKNYSFKTRSNNAQTPAVNAKLGKMTFNSLAADDIDGDKALNADDNCPFVANKNQKDSDDDRTGDVCDNAPKQKNYDQSDVDKDGVGDMIDNCKLRANPEQYDTDKDGIGNVCDTSEKGGLDNAPLLPVLEEGKPTSLLWVGVLALLAIVAGGWYFLKNRR